MLRGQSRILSPTPRSGFLTSRVSYVGCCVPRRVPRVRCFNCDTSASNSTPSPVASRHNHTASEPMSRRGHFLECDFDESLRKAGRIIDDRTCDRYGERSPSRLPSDVSPDGHLIRFPPGDWLCFLGKAILGNLALSVHHVSIVFPLACVVRSSISKAYQP